MRWRAGLLPGNTEPVAYRPLIDQEIEEAVAAGSVVVDEVGSGIVPRLLLHNLGDRPVQLVDGKQLVGAKQNRILNTTILVVARTKLEIPVACVEQGRWGRSLGAMTPAETLFPEAGRAHGRLQTACVRSPTGAISDAYHQRDAGLDAYTRAFPWCDGQAGVICGIGGAVVCADLFDHPETLRRLFPRLVRSYALDALRIEKGKVDAATGQPFMEAAAACHDDAPPGRRAGGGGTAAGRRGRRLGSGRRRPSRASGPLPVGAPARRSHFGAIFSQAGEAQLA